MDDDGRRIASIAGLVAAVFALGYGTWFIATAFGADEDGSRSAAIWAGFIALVGLGALVGKLQQRWDAHAAEKEVDQAESEPFFTPFQKQMLWAWAMVAATAILGAIHFGNVAVAVIVLAVPLLGSIAVLVTAALRRASRRRRAQG